MIKALAIALIAFYLSGCAGTGALAYLQNDEVFVGTVGPDNLNAMNASHQLLELDDMSVLTFGLDQSGLVVGVCRTRHYDGNPNSGAFDFHAFSSAGAELLSVQQAEFAQAIDAVHGSTNYTDIVQTDGNYLFCSQIGASDKSAHLVIYFQLQTQQPVITPITAVEVDLRPSNELVVTQVELFQIGDGPTNVAILPNPSMGNTVEIVDGVLNINDSPVLLDGTPVPAAQVRYSFR